jgi:NAD(P)-dependent dehydrogenase (short-subunit alcohol dehydrogenase family)
VPERVWLITGAGRGLGHAFAQAALEAGDDVVLTARDLGGLEKLARRHAPRAAALALDVTDRDAARRVVALAAEHFGRLDVLVNNAGYGLHGAVEELGEQEVRDAMETNFFGALWVTQAGATVMRRQRAGHIIQVSSTAGATGFPLVGAYSAAKFALEGLSECLALELAPFGVAVTIVEPSDFRTGFRDACRKRAVPIDDYDREFAANLDALSARHTGEEAGDPERAAQALLALVAMDDPPLRLQLGNHSFDRLAAHHRRQLEEWAAHETLARGADG